jgi:hypothetical protein
MSRAETRGRRFLARRAFRRIFIFFHSKRLTRRGKGLYYGKKAAGFPWGSGTHTGTTRWKAHVFLFFRFTTPPPPPPQYRYLIPGFYTAHCSLREYARETGASRPPPKIFLPFSEYGFKHIE